MGHIAQELTPRGKVNVAGQGLHVIEKLAACTERTADVMIKLATEVEDGVKEKSKEEQG